MLSRSQSALFSYNPTGDLGEKKAFISTYQRESESVACEQRKVKVKRRLWEAFKQAKTLKATPQDVLEVLEEDCPDEAKLFAEDLIRWLDVAFREDAKDPFAGEWIIEQELNEQESALKDHLKKKYPEKMARYGNEMPAWSQETKEGVEARIKAAKKKQRQFKKNYPIFSKQWENKRNCYQILADENRRYEVIGSKNVKARRGIAKVIQTALLASIVATAILPIFYPHLWWVSLPVMGGSIVVMLILALVKGKADRKEKRHQTRVVLSNMVASWKERAKYPASVHSFPLEDKRLKSDTMNLQKKKYAKKRPVSFEQLRKVTDKYDLADTPAMAVRAASVQTGVQEPYSKENSVAPQILSKLTRGIRPPHVDFTAEEELEDEESSHAERVVAGLKWKLAQVEYALHKVNELINDSPYYKEKLVTYAEEIQEIQDEIAALQEEDETFKSQVEALKRSIFRLNQRTEKLLEGLPATKLEGVLEIFFELETLFQEGTYTDEERAAFKAKLQQCQDAYEAVKALGLADIEAKKQVQTFNNDIRALRRRLFSLRAELKGEPGRRSLWYLPIDMAKDVVEATKLIFNSKDTRKSSYPRALHPTLEADRVKQIRFDQQLFDLDRQLTSAIRIKERSMRLVSIVANIVFVVLFFAVGMNNPWVGMGLIFAGVGLQFVTGLWGRRIEKLEKEKISLKVQKQLLKSPEIPNEVAADNPELAHLVRLTDELGLDSTQMTTGKLLAKGTLREKKSILNELPPIPVPYFKTNDPAIPAYGASRAKWDLPSSMRQKIAAMPKHDPLIEKNNHLAKCLKGLKKRQKGFEKERQRLIEKLGLEDQKEVVEALEEINGRLTEIRVRKGEILQELREEFEGSGNYDHQLQKEFDDLEKELLLKLKEKEPLARLYNLNVSHEAYPQRKNKIQFEIAVVRCAIERQQGIAKLQEKSVKELEVQIGALGAALEKFQAAKEEVDSDEEEFETDVDSYNLESASNALAFREKECIKGIKAVVHLHGDKVHEQQAVRRKKLIKKYSSKSADEVKQAGGRVRAKLQHFKEEKEQLEEKKKMAKGIEEVYLYQRLHDLDVRLQEGEKDLTAIKKLFEKRCLKERRKDYCRKKRGRKRT